MKIQWTGLILTFLLIQLVWARQPFLGFKRLNIIDAFPERPAAEKIQRFGVNCTGAGSIQTMSGLGQVTISINDYSWGLEEPEKPEGGIHSYVFSAAEETRKVIRELTASKCGFHLVIRAFNEWAMDFDPLLKVKDPVSGIERKTILRIKPVYIESWKKFIAHVIRTYPVTSIQIGLEADSEWFSAKGYMEALKTAQEVIREHKPGITLCAGGFDLGEYCVWNDLQQSRALKDAFLQGKVSFIREFIESGSAWYDVLALHADRDYTVIGPTVKWIREVMKAHGVHKRIWFDQMSSIPCFESDSATANLKHLRSRLDRDDREAVRRLWEDQSDLTVKKTLSAFSEGIEAIFLSSSSDLKDQADLVLRHSGLVSDSGKLKPVFGMYRYLVSELDGFENVSRLTNYQMRKKTDEPVVFRIQRYGRNPLFVSWIEALPRTVNLSSYSGSDRIRIIRDPGNPDKKDARETDTVNAKKVILGKNPLFYESASR